MKGFVNMFMFYLLVFVPIPGGAMSLFESKCVFSKVEGVVLEDGNPVQGAKVERYYKWGGGSNRPIRNMVKTDKQGKFNFPATYEYSIIASIFPIQPSINQKIIIQYQSKSYEAYLFWKNNYQENGELDGKPLQLVCDLKNEASREGGFYGVCILKE